MKLQNTKWLFFDMGGVILNDDEPESLRVAGLYKVAQEYLPNITMADINKAWMEGSKTFGSVRINALRILFKDSPHKDEAEKQYKQKCDLDYQELSFVRPEAHQVLAELSKRYHLGIMANQKIERAKLLETAGLLPFFSYQKMSGAIGLEKPDPNFFKSILEDSGANPEESALVDDNWYRGLLPAQQIGMHTVLFKREIIPYPKNAQPDFSIIKHADLLEIF